MYFRKQSLRAFFFLFLLICLLSGMIGIVRVPVQAASPNIVIRQVYGGGGNAGAPYTNDFVELFNLSTSNTVSLAGWSIQYASNTGTSWSVTNLSGSLAPGQYYLIQEAAGAGGIGASLPAPDVPNGTIAMSATGGKVALVNTTTALTGSGCPFDASVVDFIGYGTTADCREGGATTASNAPAPSNTTSVIRNGSGCTDTDNNSTDFTAGAPTPRNTASIGLVCGIGTYTPTLTPIPTIEVVINEVAWAGTRASSDDQWIELYNPGANVDISGWRLVSASGDLDITFPGGTLINAGGYFLIERRELATSVPANLITSYPWALNTNGDILRLRKPDGTIVDTANSNGGAWPSVSGSPNFPSMERTGVVPDSDFAWVTFAGPTNPSIIDAGGNLIYGTPGSVNSQPNVTPTFTLTTTSTPTLTTTSTLTVTSTSTRTVTPTRTNTPGLCTAGAAPSSIIINEIAWAGTGASTSDQWIELYNPTASLINLNGWILRAVDGTPNIPLANVTLPAGQYYLLERTADTTVSDVPANQIFTGAIGTFSEILQLYNAAGICVDTANSNGGSWPAGDASTHATMERVGVVHDSDNAWITNVNPASWLKHDARGTSSSNYLIHGTPGYGNWAYTVTVTPSPIPSATLKPTKFKTSTPAPLPPQPRVGINEFVPRPGHDWNNDGVVNTGDEYIELINFGVIDANLSGYSLDDDLNVGSSPYRLPTVTLKPGDRMVFYGKDTGILLSDGGDAVRLIKPNGQLADAYNYNVVKYPDQSYCRLPDNGGLDDWNTNCFPTPGLKNALSGNFAKPPTETNEDQPLCPVSDVLPFDFFLAECPSFGNIWSRFYWDAKGWFGEKSVPNNSKWNVYVD
jgi:hypothetical protein